MTMAAATSNPTADVLRKLMQDRDLTVTDLATLAGMSASTLFKILSPNWTSKPNRSTVLLAARGMHHAKPLTTAEISSIEHATGRPLPELRLTAMAESLEGANNSATNARRRGMASSMASVVAAQDTLTALCTRFGAGAMLQLLQLLDTMTARPASIGAGPPRSVSAADLPADDAAEPSPPPPPTRRIINPPQQRRTPDGIPYVEQTIVDYGQASGPGDTKTDRADKRRHA